MTTYKIISTSWALWIPTQFLFPLGGALLLHEFQLNNLALSIVSIIGLLALSLFIQRYISRAVIEIGVDRDKLSLKWTRQYLLHRRPDIELSLSDIKSYKYQEDTTFDLFKLTLKNGTVLKFWHFHLTGRDDFGKLVMDFPSIVAKHNKSSAQKSKRSTGNAQPGNVQSMIEKEKTIFENKNSPLLAGLALIMLITIPYSLFTSPTGKIKNPLLGVAVVSGSLFFLVQYTRARRKVKNEK